MFLQHPVPVPVFSVSYLFRPTHPTFLRIDLIYVYYKSHRVLFFCKMTMTFCIDNNNNNIRNNIIIIVFIRIVVTAVMFVRYRTFEYVFLMLLLPFFYVHPTENR